MKNENSVMAICLLLISDGMFPVCYTQKGAIKILQRAKTGKQLTKILQAQEEAVLKLLNLLASKSETKFDFFLENRKANAYSLKITDVLLKYRNWLSTKDFDWITNYQFMSVGRCFLSDKEGLNSVIEGVQILRFDVVMSLMYDAYVDSVFTIIDLLKKKIIEAGQNKEDHEQLPFYLHCANDTINLEKGSISQMIREMSEQYVKNKKVIDTACGPDIAKQFDFLVGPV